MKIKFCFLVIVMSFLIYLGYEIHQVRKTDDQIISEKSEQAIGKVNLKSGSKRFEISLEDQALARKNIFIRNQVEISIKNDPNLNQIAMNKIRKRKPLLAIIKILNEDVYGRNEIEWIISKPSKCTLDIKMDNMTIADLELVLCLDISRLDGLFPPTSKVSVNLRELSPGDSHYQNLAFEELSAIVKKNLGTRFRKSFYFGSLINHQFYILSGDRKIRRFTRCGLEMYLKNPHKRIRSEYSYMYRVNNHIVDDILTTMAESLADCQYIPYKSNAINNGRSLFIKNGCKECHRKKAPNIELGYPFLSYEYVDWRIRNGSHSHRIFSYKWEKRGSKLLFLDSENSFMPKYHLTKKEIDDIYQYLSHTIWNPRFKSESEQEKNGFSTLLEIVDRSCKHCHNPSEKAQKRIIKVFNSKVENLLYFPTKKYSGLIDQKFKDIASPGTNCSDSPLILRLKARHMEIEGPRESQILGMPLGQPPISHKMIEKLHQWTISGCMNHLGQPLCTACSRSQD